MARLSKPDGKKGEKRLVKRYAKTPQGTKALKQAIRRSRKA